VFAAAIHIYGGDFFGTPRSDRDPDTLQERPYDNERARKLFESANERWLSECARPTGSWWPAGEHGAEYRALPSNILRGDIAVHQGWPPVKISDDDQLYRA
jgi:hypothetical protein